MTDLIQLIQREIGIVDVEAHEHLYPAAPIPSRAQRHALIPGNHVTLDLYVMWAGERGPSERVQVAVTRIVEDGYHGTLISDPLRFNLSAGDVFWFAPKHVLSIDAARGHVCTALIDNRSGDEINSALAFFDTPALRRHYRDLIAELRAARDAAWARDAKGGAR